MSDLDWVDLNADKTCLRERTALAFFKSDLARAQTLATLALNRFVGQTTGDGRSAVLNYARLAQGALKAAEAQLNAAIEAILFERDREPRALAPANGSAHKRPPTARRGAALADTGPGGPT